MTDELLIRFLLNEATTAEKISITTWLEESPANKKYFSQFEQIWLSSKNLASNTTVNEDQAWLKFRERTRTRTTVVPLKRNWAWLKIAALLLLAAGLWTTYSLFKPQAYTDLASSNQVITEKLPDGSELTLNKNSRISYASNFEKHRSLKLTQGDVFFQVAHDKSHPFVIEIEKVSVTVVGTSFNIKHLHHQTEVIVETGIVKVQIGKEEIELRKGEKVWISASASQLVKEQSTDELYAYYRTQLFVARNTPLSVLLATLSEAYGTEIILSSPGLKNKPITTTLKGQASLDKNLQYIAETMDLKISRNQNQILLSENK
jgi:transmembrane sensor